MDDSPSDHDAQTAAQRATAWGRARAERVTGRFETLRERVAIVDVGARVYERDKEAAGTLLGSALAVRLFLFFMPFVLLVVGLAGVPLRSREWDERDRRGRNRGAASIRARVLVGDDLGRCGLRRR